MSAFKKIGNIYLARFFSVYIFRLLGKCFYFSESGQPEVPLDRQFLVNELNIVEDPNGRSV